MRIAFLGPIGEYSRAAIDLVSRSFEELGATRVIYVGGDDSFERLVDEHFGAHLTNEHARVGFWQRTLSCRGATAEQVDSFIAAEERLLTLLRVEVPAEDATERELATLGTWRLLPSSGVEQAPAAPRPGLLLVRVGAQQEAHFPERRDGSVVFAPGSLDSAGLLLLEARAEPASELRAQLYDRSLEPLRQCSLRPDQ